MNHQETLNFWAAGQRLQMMHLGLHRTRAMMQALGNPQDRYPAIHIAGTNGKGSVAAMSESILRHAGLKTGLYTSPHLVRVEERLRINGRPVSPGKFSSLATRIRKTELALMEEKVLDRPLTTFEFLTCCAFLHFANEKVDMAVFESGTRRKRTPPTSSVYISVIPVFTGSSELLDELSPKLPGKGGNLKEIVPVISACSAAAPRRVIGNQAKKVCAPLIEIGRDAVIENVRDLHGRFSFDLRTPRREYKNLRLSLAGEHQTRNAALAVLAIEALKSIPIKIQDIRAGLSNTGWPGRLDTYPSKRRTLLDGAHNPEGARLLKDFLTRQKEKEVHMVFGAVRDKNIRGMGSAVFPLATSIHLTPLLNTRTADPDAIAAMHKRYQSRMKLHGSMQEALYAAWKECSPSGLVVVTGSLYLVGELLPLVQPTASLRDSSNRRARRPRDSLRDSKKSAIYALAGLGTFSQSLRKRSSPMSVSGC
jgi:dihydrofolate synthase/folylpolyglutamate synthase